MNQTALLLSSLTVSLSFSCSYNTGHREVPYGNTKLESWTRVNAVNWESSGTVHRRLSGPSGVVVESVSRFEASPHARRALVTRTASPATMSEPWHIVDLESGSLTSSFAASWGPVSWSPDDRWLVGQTPVGVTPAGFTISLIDAESRGATPTQLWESTDPTTLVGMSWSPDSRAVAVIEHLAVSKYPNSEHVLTLWAAQVASTSQTRDTAFHEVEVWPDEDSRDPMVSSDLDIGWEGGAPFLCRHPRPYSSGPCQRAAGATPEGE
jgi:hypothetical protein